MPPPRDFQMLEPFKLLGREKHEGVDHYIWESVWTRRLFAIPVDMFWSRGEGQWPQE